MFLGLFLIGLAGATILLKSLVQSISFWATELKRYPGESSCHRLGLVGFRASVKARALTIRSCDVAPHSCHDLTGTMPSLCDVRAIVYKLPVGSAPGLGIDLDEKVISAHPFNERPYSGVFYADGGIADV